MDKQSLRSLAKERRNAFILNNKLPFAPCPTFTQMLARRPIVAGYSAKGSEADPRPFIAAARAQGCTIALPRLTSRDGAMTFHSVETNTPLEPGPYGLQQPPPCAPIIAPEIILLPLLGFTRRGDRLGQGGGHYDRALTHLPNATRIGIAWSVQEMAALPTDPWDMPLHYIVTEKEWMKA